MIQFRRNRPTQLFSRNPAPPRDAADGPNSDAPDAAHFDAERVGADPQSEVEGFPPPPANVTPRSDTLHVGLDVRFWEMSGLGTFERELLAGFARTGLPLRFTCIGPEAVQEQLPPGVNVTHWIDYDTPVYSPQSLIAYPNPGAVDLFHYPHYNLPLVRTRCRVVNVFDLFHLNYGNVTRRIYQRMLMRRLRWAGRNSVVVTASDKVSRSLAQEFGIKPARIRRVFPGPGRSIPTTRPVRPEVKTLNGQTLRGPWLLATGIDQPHKNFDFMLSALSLYYQRRPDAPPLVWVGLSAEAIARRSRQLTAHTRQRVALEEYTDSEPMEGLLAGAAALIFPSLDEGFGFPPLEAMARGVPVLCARREPMTRHLGNAPLWFEPAESASLWRMLDRLIDNAPLRQEQIANGYTIANYFNWDRAAHQYFGLYQELVQGAQRARRL